MNTNSHKILIVEDDADDRYVIHLAFAELGYEEHVKVFDNPENFLRYLNSLPDSSLYPSLIMLDCNMPGMNGTEVLMRLKMNDALHDIPVAMYSTGMRIIENKTKAMTASFISRFAIGFIIFNLDLPIPNWLKG